MTTAETPGLVAGQRAAGQVSGDDRGLPGGALYGDRQHVAVALQHARQQGRSGGVERRVEQGDEEQQRQQDAHRQAVHGDQADEHGARHVGHDHHGAVRVPLGEGGQQRAADHPRQVADGERGRRQGHRPGLLEHHRGDGGAGEIVPHPRQHHRGEDRPVLPVGEHLAEGRWPIGGGSFVGHRRPSRGRSERRDCCCPRLVAERTSVGDAFGSTTEPV
jgi:hypothetical protein